MHIEINDYRIQLNTKAKQKSKICQTVTKSMHRVPNPHSIVMIIHRRTSIFNHCDDPAKSMHTHPRLARTYKHTFIQIHTETHRESLTHAQIPLRPSRVGYLNSWPVRYSISLPEEFARNGIVFPSRHDDTGNMPNSVATIPRRQKVCVEWRKWGNRCRLIEERHGRSYNVCPALVNLCACAQVASPGKEMKVEKEDKKKRTRV